MIYRRILLSNLRKVPVFTCDIHEKNYCIASEGKIWCEIFNDKCVEQFTRKESLQNCGHLTSDKKKTIR